jgi:hypothetical protein
MLVLFIPIVKQAIWNNTNNNSNSCYYVIIVCALLVNFCNILCKGCIEVKENNIVVVLHSRWYTPGACWFYPFLLTKQYIRCEKSTWTATLSTTAICYVCRGLCYCQQYQIRNKDCCVRICCAVLLNIYMKMFYWKVKYQNMVHHWRIQASRMVNLKSN